ncbi:MAG: DUF4148 domain-containing protein [Burkholderiales bacterium]|nr:DUF4148 domain-containing protein [Burkholderiales bacterium]
MKTLRLTLAAGLALAIAAPAFAQEAEPDTWMVPSSTQPRGVVVAERDDAQRAQRLVAAPTLPEELAWMQAAVSIKTRAQVRAELLAARASGEFDRIQAEAASFDPAPSSATRLAGTRR